MAKCKYCEKDDLKWERIDGKWILHEDAGDKHICPQEREETYIEREHKVGDVVIRKGAGCNGLTQGHYYAVFKEAIDERHIKTWEFKGMGGVAKEKMKIVRDYSNIKTGDIVYRPSGNHTGSNGRVEKDKLYRVLAASNHDIALFYEKNKPDKIEGCVWMKDKFRIAVPVEAYENKQKIINLDIMNDDDDDHDDVQLFSTEDIENHEYEIKDIPFDDRSTTNKQTVLKGHQWFCNNCNSAWKTEKEVIKCCMADSVTYTEMPDSYWWSTSKREPVLIAKMLNVHLKNAIQKLERELDNNLYFHLLPALVAEAERRQMNWQEDDDVIEDSELNDVKEQLGL